MEAHANKHIFDSRESVSELTDADWRELGFSDPVRAQHFFETLRDRPECSALSAGQFKVVAQTLSVCCDPDQALSLFESWIDVGGLPLTPSWFEPHFLKALFALFSSTPALSSYFIRFPARTQPALQTVLSREVIGGKAWGWLLAERMKLAASHAERLATLRRMRVEFMLQIATLDLLLISPLNSTVRALSELADACVSAALKIAEENLRPRIGWLPYSGSTASGVIKTTSKGPGEIAPIAVFALGKLGGGELNYSSDIDLVFTHRAEGETQGGARTVTAEAYVTALAEELIAALDKVTEDGRVYRVDVRLRPHGTAGALVRGFAETMNYFQAEGRTWERQAWLKARAIAGDVQTRQ